jgi:hypothetical protein
MVDSCCLHISGIPGEDSWPVSTVWSWKLSVLAGVGEFWFLILICVLSALLATILKVAALPDHAACMETLHVSGVYKVRSILQMWIIMEIRQMKTIFQNYLVISELECVMRWFRNTEHSVMCLCMLTLALIPNKIKTWKVRNTRSSLRFGITNKLQIYHKSYYSKIYYFYYNSGTRNDISLVDAPI